MACVVWLAAPSYRGDSDRGTTQGQLRDTSLCLPRATQTNHVGARGLSRNCLLKGSLLVEQQQPSASHLLFITVWITLLSPSQPTVHNLHCPKLTLLSLSQLSPKSILCTNFTLFNWTNIAESNLHRLVALYPQNNDFTPINHPFLIHKLLVVLFY